MKEILKNNILSIICGVVVIIALIVPIWPMGGYRQELESRLAERVGVAKSVADIRAKTRNLPVVDPDSTTPTPLEGFPDENIIAKGTQLKTTFEAQSKQLIDEAIKLNKKNLLVPGSLPTPANNAVAIAFRDRYRSLIGPQTPGATPTVAPTLGGIAQQLKVGFPPTQAEIELAIGNLWRSKYQPQLGGAPGAGGNDRARQLLQAEFDAEKARIPDIERNRVANNSLLYMNHDALPFIQSFSAREAPSPLDLWNAQLHLWIIDDVGAGLLEANRGAKNVVGAPVKHLVKINIPYPNPYVVMPGQTMDGELSGPAPKVTDLAVQGQQSTTPMTTGRVSNPLYDVVQFDLELNVEADKINDVIAALCRNRFFTVVSANVTAVDSFALRQQGYMYGAKPIVKLALRVEALFFHAWSRPLMPKAMSDLMMGVQPGMTPGMEGDIPMY